MTDLTVWEPFREMRRMHETLDRMFDRALLGSWWDGADGAGLLPIDLYETDEEIVIKAAAPGLKPEDLNISITGDTVNIHGEVVEEREDENARYYLKERRFGSFTRSIALPTSVNADKAKAEFENGILTLTIPKSEEAKPKTITVKAK